MSYEYGTPHYNLPQTIGTDKRDWFDTNECFAQLDSAVATAVQVGEDNKREMAAMRVTFAKIDAKMVEFQGRVDDVEAEVTAANKAIVELGTRVDTQDRNLWDAIEASNEETAIASQSHGPGTYFVYNETLYQVIGNGITKGAEIVPSVNCWAVDIGTLLFTLQHTYAYENERTNHTAYFAHVGGEKFFINNQPAIAIPPMQEDVDELTNYTISAIHVGDTLVLDENYILANAHANFGGKDLDVPIVRGKFKSTMTWRNAARMLGYVLLQYSAELFGEASRYEFSWFDNCVYRVGRYLFRTAEITHDVDTSYWYIRLSLSETDGGNQSSVVEMQISYNEDDNIQTAVTATVNSIVTGTSGTTVTDMSDAALGDGKVFAIYPHPNYPIFSDY